MFNAANRSSTANLATHTALLQSASSASTAQWLPGDLIPGWIEDGTNVTFPIASLSEYNLTAANADALTGDARAVMAALCSRMFDWHQELEVQPGAVLASVQSRRMIKSGNWANKDKQAYSFKFYLDYPTSTIADEV